MTEIDPLAGIDGPRQLPDALRQRLEARLVHDQPRPLEAELAGRLSASLSRSSDRSRGPGLKLTRVKVAAGVAAGLFLVGGGIGVTLSVSGHHSTDRVSAGAAAGTSARSVAGTTSGKPGRPGVPTPVTPSDQRSASTPAIPSTQGLQGSAASSSGGYESSSGASAPAVPLPASDAPVVTSVSPTRGPAAGGTWVTIDGSNLGSVRSITFGGVAAARIQVVSDTSLRVESPAHPAGPVPVVAVNSSGGRTVTGFTYTGG